MSLMLFEPLELRGVVVKNRIAVAPMMTYASPNGFVTNWHLMHLGKLAAGGAGLVMMESTKVERRGCSTTHDAGLWRDEFVEPLRRVVDFIKAQGAVAGIQLSHSGRKAKTTLPWEGFEPLRGEQLGAPDLDSWEPIGPSAIAHSPAHPVPQEMTREDIRDVVTAWGEATVRADRAGFDVVEIHAAHGYLIHEFLSPAANHRSDEYGGSLSNRMRFALEVAERVRASWPADKPLFMRISATDDNGWTLENSVSLSRALKEVGVDVIDCSSGGMEYRAVQAMSRTYDYGYQVPYAQRIRAEARVKTMAVGLIIHADQAEEILRGGRADLVAIGRELLHNPNWPLDAAQKLNAPETFSLVPPAYGFWLEKRAASNFGGNPSTWQRGLFESA